MKQTRDIMGMPITLEIVGSEIKPELFDEVFSYFKYVDEKFSTYKKTSEISAINLGELPDEKWSDDMKEVFALSEETKRLTYGYFDIVSRDGKYDPSGMVKGWAISKAAKLLKKRGTKNFYVEAGGDIQTSGVNAFGLSWSVGIQNPFSKTKEVVKTLRLKDCGIATSGTYIRGQHIYNPKNKSEVLDEVVSLTVVAQDIYEADRFATAAFAMGKTGIGFIEQLPGFEGYQIDRNGMATMTSGFSKYCAKTYA
jgi:thiamine biosynthesis lipoprotein